MKQETKTTSRASQTRAKEKRKMTIQQYQMAGMQG
jgi:hypothetical protein